MSNAPAIVLFSGGLDSTTCLSIARLDGFTPIALSFRYGQRHAVELEAAARIAAEAGIEHMVIDIDLARIGGSALTDSSIDVPTYDDTDELGSESSIPATYVPARNTIMLSYGLAVAEAHGAADIYIGVNSVDYSGYPDCRPEFIEAFQQVAELATKAAVTGAPMTIHAPLIEMSKAQIIEHGLMLGVDYSLTTSCYDPAGDGTPCGRCDACILRARGFAEAGHEDPAITRHRLGSNP